MVFHPRLHGGGVREGDGGAGGGEAPGAAEEGGGGVEGAAWEWQAGNGGGRERVGDSGRR